MPILPSISAAAAVVVVVVVVGIILLSSFIIVDGDYTCIFISSLTSPSTFCGPNYKLVYATALLISDNNNHVLSHKSQALSLLFSRDS